MTTCFPLDYFSQHLGEYLNVLSALESLNIAILRAMDKTKEVSLCLFSAGFLGWMLTSEEKSVL